MQKESNISTSYIECKPFLRWAGGKRWLLKIINDLLPKKGFNQYHEPFVGGGALFLYLQPKISFISDLNKELIDSYIAIQQEVELVIEHLNKLKNTKEDYYKIRRHKFNMTSKNAARFIYLNQVSFNGIFRVNLNGEYNVPYGFREKYQFDFENLRKVSKVLQGVDIRTNDFAKIIYNVKKGDLVFIDPPYTVTHNDNGFFHYNQKLFSIEDQYRLSQTIKEMKEIGAYYILTNAAHKKVRDIFNFNDKIIEIERASLIGGKNAKRGKFAELIITNVI